MQIVLILHALFQLLVFLSAAVLPAMTPNSPDPASMVLAGYAVGQLALSIGLLFVIRDAALRVVGPGLGALFATNAAVMLAQIMNGLAQAAVPNLLFAIVFGALLLRLWQRPPAA